MVTREKINWILSQIAYEPSLMGLHGDVVTLEATEIRGWIYPNEFHAPWDHLLSHEDANFMVRAAANFKIEVKWNADRTSYSFHPGEGFISEPMDEYTRKA